MLNIGENHRLIIDRETEPGLFLKNAEGDEVLLPNKYIPENFQLEDEIEVFVYLDHSERPVATTLEPYVKLDEFAFLECVETTDFGAFLDWGLEKHLFVPFKEQVYPMQKGHRYLIFCYLDEDTNRLVASSKVHAFLFPRRISRLNRLKDVRGIYFNARETWRRLSPFTDKSNFEIRL